MSSIKKLMEGYFLYQEGYFKERKSLYSKLSSQGQNPKIAIISCSDSRVSPANIFQVEPGELFVIRNAGNFIPHYKNSRKFIDTCASIEFAIKNLEIKDIIVLGHSSCGCIQCLLEPCIKYKNDTEFIGSLLHSMKQVRKKVLEQNPDIDINELAPKCEQYAIELSIDNLKSFPYIKEKIDLGLLKVHGWYFEIDSCNLSTLNGFNVNKQ